MEKIFDGEIDNKRVCIYQGYKQNLPIIYSTDFYDGIPILLKKCEEINCKEFNLVSISEVEWDEFLSPWPADKVISREDNFSGGSPEYLKWILEKVVPLAESRLYPDTISIDRISSNADNMGTKLKSYVSGYSMAGLFALWAMYQTDFFSGAVSASGSLWFPGFRDYALNNDFKSKPEGIYLSLGGKESKSRNPYLSQTETINRELVEHYRTKGIKTIFEVNPGNHFRDADLRVAKGIKWLLNQ